MKTAGNSAQHALIHFIARCCKAENWASLSHLGVSPKQACRIGRLSAYESHALGDIFQQVAAVQLHFANLEECLQEMRAGTLAQDGSGQCQETELCMNLFRHIADLYRDNKHGELHRIGLQPEQAQLLCELPSFEVQRLSQHFWRFTVFEMDARKLEQAIETAVGTARWLRQRMELVRAGAPRELMDYYYNMNCEMYARMRKMHGIRLRGRPRVLSDDVQSALYKEFVDRYYSDGEQSDPLRQPEFFLGLYDSMGRKVPLREIWTLVQGWIRDEEAHGPSGRTKS